MKKCSKCKIEKNEEDFGKDKQKKDGLCSSCKECKNKQSLAWNNSNKDRVKINGIIWREKNKERLREISRLWRLNNAEKHREYSKEWQKKNPEKCLAKSRKWYSENREKALEKAARYKSNNKEKVNQKDINYRKLNPKACAESSARWREKNKDQVTIHARKRRAAKLAADGSHTAKDVEQIFKSQFGKCANCKTELLKSGIDKFHVDHIVPLSKGGSNDKYNLQCLCPSCNLRKSSKDPIDWANQNWRLL